MVRCVGGIRARADRNVNVNGFEGRCNLELALNIDADRSISSCLERMTVMTIYF